MRKRSTSDVRVRARKPRTVAPQLVCALASAVLVCTLLAGCASQAASGDSASAGAAASSTAAPSAAADSNDASSSSPAAASVHDAQDPLVVDSGWDAKNGYVHYGLMIENPNADLVGDGVSVRIVSYDDAGAVLSDEVARLAELAPGTTAGYCGLAGSGMTPARVEFTLIPEETTWSDGSSYETPFTIENFAEQDKLYFRYEVTGEVTNRTDAYVSTVPIDVIMRGDEGTIVAGYTGAAYRVKADRTKDFLITMDSAPAHASIELYPHPESDGTASTQETSQ